MAGFCSRGSLASLYVTAAVTDLLAAPAKAADTSSSATGRKSSLPQSAGPPAFKIRRSPCPPSAARNRKRNI